MTPHFIFIKTRNILFLFCLLLCFESFAQPFNDNCNNAIPVNITNSGFDLGLFTSAQTDLTSGTLQSGETFSPSINTAGLNKKSVWYKFTIPTTRSVRVSLAQPGSAIQAGNVGFTVYKTTTCLPGDAQISTKLSPIETFGSTFHPCVADGEYYIQVSSNNNANGPVFLTVEIADANPSPYDKPATAYPFGSLTPNQQVFKDVDIECQSIDDANEVCLSATSFKDYTKSIWYTFTTPAYFDYLNTWFASITTPYGSPSIKIGYRIYQGDATTTPLSGLTQIGGCDSLMTDLYAIDRKQYRCGELLPNTTYTVQLLFHKDFKNTIRFGADWNGRKATNGPLPVSSLATPNNMGTLAANNSTYGIMTSVSDVFGCNSRHSLNSCPKSMPAAGVLYNGHRFNLSSFISFNLASTSSLFFNYPAYPCSVNLLFRLYKQGLTTSCTDLDTTNIISTFGINAYTSSPLSCLAPGNYILQVMAVDSTRPKGNIHNSSLYTYNLNQMCTNTGLGGSYTLNIYARTEVASNKFSLSAPGKFEKLNINGAGVMQPLQRNIKYTATIDTFGCANTVLPSDTLCNPHNIYGYLGKASYREFVLADSSMLFFEQVNTQSSKVYQGDADALTTAQNKHSFPERFTGLLPSSKCMDTYYSSNRYACAVPGTYTHASFDNRLSFASTMAVTPKSGKSKYGSPTTAQNMGDLWSYVPVNTWFQSGLDTFACYDNPVTIDGVVPCNSLSGRPSTKLIYRQFYLSKPTLLNIINYVGYSGEIPGSGVFTLFKGKATDGIDSLKKVNNAWTCFTRNTSAGQCDALPVGWYTVVSYGSGPTFTNPTGGMDPTTNYHQSTLGSTDKFMIYLGQACAEPKFNRPHKASIDTLTGQPYKIEWGPQTGHTAAYPVTSKKYTLNNENFNCSVDTSFIKQYMTNCNADNVKVAFYVFKTTQESYIQIDGIADGLWSRLYAFDVRTADSAKLKTDTSFQPCLNKIGQMEFCRLQPGTYTLVYFAPISYTCNSVTPTIYIDQVGTSRFDHANNAYDFGTIKPDSVWYSGKIGEVNPLDANRAASNDFFYCTTGAQQNDPADATCYTLYNPSIYNNNNGVLHPNNATAPNSSTVDRRNLWYTFAVSQPGTVGVRVTNKTPGKQHQYLFAIYKSDVDGNLPFGSVVAGGLVDSTLLSGLTLVKHNVGYICAGTRDITFFVEPCSFKSTRYYIVVENRNSLYYAQPRDMNPNSQVEVSVILDSVIARPPKFDHFSQANDLGLVNNGIKKGETDNYTCASRDLPDPIAYQYVSNCNKTLWYKFTTTITGQIRYAAFFKGINEYYYNHIQLFRQIKPNDSSSTGLQHMPYTTSYNNNGTWAQQCISPGTYYIILPGCNAVDEDVYPQIEIIPQAGDFCSAPMITGLTGPGTRVVPVTIDCHTIGTDYGEFNPTLTCPANATTNNYKTSWYRLDITGTDTLDVTVYLNENTNATSTDIKYRMMTGSCGAMQEQSCVQDALTRNTYKCLAPGNSYYIQVFTPNFINGSTKVVGTIDLNISAVVHADSCFPANNCIGVANFTPKFDCTKDRSTLFTNYSTFGSAITYQWDFGHNNQTSNAVSPSYFYPALTTAATYTVKLLITNTTAGCNKKDSATQTITIPARPAVNLGPDTLSCMNGQTVLLNATSHPGSTYYWYNGSTQPTATFGGIASPWVEVTYNGCKARDTINIWINPIAKKALQTQALCNVTTVALNASRGQGEQYTWSNGASTSSITVAQPGYYWADLYLNGCTVRDSFYVVSTDLRPLGNDTTICQRNMPYTANATVSGATGYSWQNNSTAPTFNITQSGMYWVSISLGGCVFRDTILVSVDSFKTVSTLARICQGQTYTLPSGQVVALAGNYKDTLKNSKGCDSIITNVTLKVDASTSITSSVSICAGQTYTLPSGATISNPGTYRDTIRYTSGCDSLVTAITLTVSSVTAITRNPSICQGQSYTLPQGQVVTISGTYIDTISRAGICDSIITTVLTVKTVSNNTLSPTICAGQTYTMPSGLIVNATGTYSDTLRYAGGCDSIRTTINLTVKQVITSTLNPFICQGQSYTLPSGTVVTLAGTYKDTVRYVGGCDSLRSTIDLTVRTVTRLSNAGVICAGQSYMLPSGAIVTNAGTYNDTIRYVTGCDSVIHTINLTVKAVANNTLSPTICAGQIYTLPSGLIVSATGIYRDTLRYNSGCDSIRTTVNLTVKSVTTSTLNPFICQGQSYTLPSGTVVTLAGTYKDTVRYAGGCDSLRSTIDLTVRTVTRLSNAGVICAGQSYMLPSGATVTNAGTYNDTIRYVTGCDSVIHTINLTVKAVANNTLSPTICAGQIYTLPSGLIVSATGIYRDTLRYNSGCDSIRTTVNLTVKSVTTSTLNPFICQGQSYTLPSGTVVTIAGTYKDTVRYAGGCDSLRSTINLTVKMLTRQSNAATICAGQAYTLPSGNLATTTGTYNDTLRYATGCDSLITTINLQVKPVVRATINPTICAGQTYILPSGLTVNSSGTYTDTLKYKMGCDSVINTINLTVKTLTRSSINASICAGQLYIMPSGATAGNAGNYIDTVRYSTGCDSLITTVLLSLKTATRVSTANTICQGQSITLPSGTVVTTSGVYSDTLRYISGCDSLITTATITVKPVLKSSLSPSICAGTSFTTPSGLVINTTGIYSDTIKYQTGGCDSLITTINLQVKQAVKITVNPSICIGETYALPSGINVNTAGNYTDIMKDRFGCDSIVTTINLTINPKPIITLSKSNDINCIVGSATLTASGGRTYAWSPSAGLSNAVTYNPIASPTVTTIYKVSVTTARGCTSADSIQLVVDKGDADGGYLLPSAFTPNADGKNDCFGVKAWGAVSDLEMFVYDRWGNTLFSTTDPSKCWDGTYNGNKMGTGAYVYYVKATTICGPVLRKGSIVLIR